jgi:hypothetical protein
MPAAASTTWFWFSSAILGEIASVLKNIRSMTEAVSPERAADAYARMMQGKARFRIVLVTRAESLIVRSLPHDWKVSLEEKEISVSSKLNSNEKSEQTELARSRAAAGPEGKSAHEEIRRRAYEIYLERDGQPGTEIDDWLQAERELEGGGMSGAQAI